MTPLKLFTEYHMDKLGALKETRELEGTKITGDEECFCLCRMDYWEWLLHKGKEDENNPPPVDWKPLEMNFPNGIPTISSTHHEDSRR